MVLLAPGRALAAQCGLPDSQPWWIDFSDGSVSFRNDLFGRPGVIAATEGTTVASTLRAGGATTIYWQMHMERQVGTNATPADPATVPAAADQLFDTAAASSACATPLVALNELTGQTIPPPWSPTTATYRADVLALLDGLARRGSRPFLLLPNSQPNLDGDSLLWWQRVAQSADLVRQVYLNAPTVMAQTPLLASRTLRMRLRDAAQRLLSIGLPAARVGLMLGFHSGNTLSGRSGLQPREAWLEYVKLNALAVRQVAGELGLGSIWSWGWGTFNDAGADPDKPAAACVYLWTRGARLCDGPAAAGPAFDTSLTEGQIDFPASVQCTFGPDRIQRSAVEAASALTHDPTLGFSAVFARVVQRAQVRVTSAQILAAQARIIRTKFRGKRASYLAALKRAGLTAATAQNVIADELRRTELAQPAGGDVKGWTETRERAALDAAICRGDELPAVADVRLATYAPFLKLAPV
jgi:hypothetical protein